MMLCRYHVAIVLNCGANDPEIEWEDEIIANNSAVAVITALQMIHIRTGETIHEIHVGPARPWEPNSITARGKPADGVQDENASIPASPNAPPHGEAA